MFAPNTRCNIRRPARESYTPLYSWISALSLFNFLRNNTRNKQADYTISATRRSPPSRRRRRKYELLGSPLYRETPREPNYWGKGGVGEEQNTSTHHKQQPHPSPTHKTRNKSQDILECATWNENRGGHVILPFSYTAFETGGVASHVTFYHINVKE